MKKLLLLLLLILSVPVIAQNDFAQINPIDRHLLKSNIYSVSLPFELVQNLIVIDNLVVNGRKGKFIFDTGNQASLVLNDVFFRSEIATEINKQTLTDTARGITGNIPVVTNIKIDSLIMGDFIFAGFDAIAFNLEGVRSLIGRDFLGFIGYGILKEVEFAIDYKNKVVHIYRLNESGNPEEDPAYVKRELLDFSLEKGSMMANIYFGGKMIDFFLDTGAPKNSLDANLVKQLDQTYLSFTGLKDTITGGDGGSIITNDALMTQLAVKDITFEYMDTNVYPFPGNAGYKATLGYPFFKQKVFAVNYFKKKLYICEIKKQQ